MGVRSGLRGCAGGTATSWGAGPSEGAGGAGQDRRRRGGELVLALAFGGCLAGGCLQRERRKHRRREEKDKKEKEKRRKKKIESTQKGFCGDSAITMVNAP